MSVLGTVLSTLAIMNSGVMDNPSPKRRNPIPEITDQHWMSQDLFLLDSDFSEPIQRKTEVSCKGRNNGKKPQKNQKAARWHPPCY